MLIIEEYGVVLRQVTLDDIEMVRSWRNDPSVSKYMLFREHISQEMQQRWFEGVCARGDLYFILNFQGEDVGLLNLKDIDPRMRMAEGGIFVVPNGLLNSHLPYRAILCLLDFAFDVLRFRRVSAHILDDNKRAIRYNESLGYKLTDASQEGGGRLYFLEKEDYDSCSAKLKKILRLNSNPLERKL
ncbi:MAG: hypothetical protein C0631_04080 [Sedimenticola sp.]|nr:MAG: hypothetical protein C0631_04080 [Sedimenticola sp.]